MSLRTDRVASLVKEEAGMFIARELNDRAVGLITVMEVQMTPDLKIARIYVSVLGSPEVKEAALARLEEIKGELRSHLGSHIRLKFTPSVQFHLDETMERVDKINRLIQQIHKDDAPKSDPS
jgi:ribosome-binding factor A